MTADLRLSGRIDGERVRGTLQVGVTRDAMRLEGLAPFGAPVFVLAAQPGAARCCCCHARRRSPAAHRPPNCSTPPSASRCRRRICSRSSRAAACRTGRSRGGATFGDDVDAARPRSGPRRCGCRHRRRARRSWWRPQTARWRVEYTRTERGLADRHSAAAVAPRRSAGRSDRRRLRARRARRRWRRLPEGALRRRGARRRARGDRSPTCGRGRGRGRER